MSQIRWLGFPSGLKESAKAYLRLINKKPEKTNLTNGNSLSAKSQELKFRGSPITWRVGADVRCVRAGGVSLASTQQPTYTHTSNIRSSSQPTYVQRKSIMCATKLPDAHNLTQKKRDVAWLVFHESR